MRDEPFEDEAVRTPPSNIVKAAKIGCVVAIVVVVGFAAGIMKEFHVLPTIHPGSTLHRA